MFVVKGGKTPLLLIDRPIKQADDQDLKQKQNLLNHRFFLSELTCQSSLQSFTKVFFAVSTSFVNLLEKTCWIIWSSFQTIQLLVLITSSLWNFVFFFQTILIRWSDAISIFTFFHFPLIGIQNFSQMEEDFSALSLLMKMFANSRLLIKMLLCAFINGTTINIEQVQRKSAPDQ